MQLIKPKQISGEIMTLFEEAESKVIIICPYYKIGKWYKLLNCFEDLSRRKIDVEFYVRENERESVNELRSIGFNPVSIPNLHTKLYLNEKYGIVSSMNLLLSSDTSSLDIALKTETMEEYDDLLNYYNRYIKGTVNTVKSVSNQTVYNWLSDLDKRLSKTSGNRVTMNLIDHKLNINANNQYVAFISNGRTNDLRICGILSNKEFHFIQNNSRLDNPFKLSIELVRGKKGGYDAIWSTTKGYKSYSLNELRPDEAKGIVDSIINFITTIQELKSMVH